ncbi:helix-turn-helix transcriptional regulator [Pantoea sp. 18069]|uniref:AraC family transcriptional regulator n=1 Tax=Pantoea sp. 18069 TaxID=2681415 RepID=UPI00190F7828|nr:helix-turn-helix transcriptional regulator [Pantoea sp. 18069]
MRHTPETPLHPQALAQVESSDAAVTCLATDYPAGWNIPPHAHGKHQLLHAIQGVMVVHADAGQWIVPPSRGLWMPAGMTHSLRCIGEVQMRSLFVQRDAAPQLFASCQVVGVSPLLRELIRAAVDVVPPSLPDSRDARLLRLLLDELHALPVLPLHLPMPTDPRVLAICRRLQQRPDDTSTLADWAAQAQIDGKTIQRLFAAQTGMTFGRWRQQARLLRALELLAGGDKVIDVALALGYDSPSAFATMFRKHFGQTPSQFFQA